MAPNVCSLLCVALLVAGQSARARLGESPEQCTERYGKPEVVEAKAPAELKHIYRVGGMTITTEFIGGKVAAIFYAKKRRTPFTSEEIEAHMLINGGGKPWGKMAIIPLGSAGDKIYRWGAQDRAAQYYEGAGLLAFTANVYGEKKRAATEAEKDNAKNGAAAKPDPAPTSKPE